jgi:hypothetical protein
MRGGEETLLDDCRDSQILRSEGYYGIVLFRSVPARHGRRATARAVETIQTSGRENAPLIDPLLPQWLEGAKIVLKRVGEGRQPSSLSSQNAS